ncbi:MAG: hypothetical protein JNG84_00075 [Archangium sp.]|nr:hypothetical protein [Archangium sp.]
MTHADSACARVRLSTAKVEPLTTRVMPSDATTTLTCGQQFSLPPYAVAIQCRGTRRGRRTLVEFVITDGPRTRVAKVGAHDGHSDFIVLYLRVTTDLLDVTVDFGTFD